jgi:hypothetical protein
LSALRYICSTIFKDRNARRYRVSFQIAEEGSWDHRFEDLTGGEIDPEDLWLSHRELLAIQEACDQAVVCHNLRLSPAEPASAFALSGSVHATSSGAPAHQN